ncbi:hypothetical protein CAPTEDRAFT_215154 [Capitella teleta]|uniref:Uncharacterized protein n=1 Tax=Capitella teleta TaxID=283909 RepID=R7V2S1_CAPTE|nr:hypothetical protein CAPTEDRAFT_215154 [Capitella teleta]|eukprot:ELU10621.1 hypothetical protein CAPTEDRAFT_215154 [Capitella teleta]
MSTNEPIFQPTPQAGHTAVCFGDTVVVWGGYTVTVTMHNYHTERYIDPEKLSVYDVETDSWRRVPTTGKAPPAKSGASAVAVGRHMYIVGGNSAVTHNANHTYCLDFPRRTWKYIPTGDPGENPSVRDKFSAWHYNNKIYIFGGYGPSLDDYLYEHGRYVVDESMDSIDRGWNNQLLALDLDTHRWSDIHTSGSVPTARAAHATVIVDDRALDVTGDIPCGRSWHSFTPFDNRHLFLYGGYSQDNQALSDCWIFDTGSCTWKEMPNRKQHRLWHTANKTSSGDIVIFGGCENDILNHNVDMRQSNEIMLFRFSPKSLVCISLDLAVNFRKILAPEFCDLPKSLRERVKRRIQCRILTDRLKKPNSDPNLVFDGQSGQTCDIS